MASTPLQPVVQGVVLTTGFVELYEVESDIANFGIDAAAFNNVLTGTVLVSIRIIKSGETAVTADEIVTNRSIRKQDTFLAPSIIGQSLNTGDTIEAKADTANAINVFITGTKVNS